MREGRSPLSWEASCEHAYCKRSTLSPNVKEFFGEPTGVCAMTMEKPEALEAARLLARRGARPLVREVGHVRWGLRGMAATVGARARTVRSTTGWRPRPARWRSSILLDQIPRNSFRGSARQFETDAKAVEVADAPRLRRGTTEASACRCACSTTCPSSTPRTWRCRRSASTSSGRSNDQELYYFALVHADVIRRFGRFPHRNAVLGRETTEAERVVSGNGWLRRLTNEKGRRWAPAFRFVGKRRITSSRAPRSTSPRRGAAERRGRP